jgi:hypothetical protein
LAQLTLGLYHLLIVFALHKFDDVSHALMYIVSKLHIHVLHIPAQPVRVAVPRQAFSGKRVRSMNEKATRDNQKIVIQVSYVFNVLVLVHPITDEAFVVERSDSFLVSGLSRWTPAQDKVGLPKGGIHCKPDWASNMVRGDG